MRVLIFGGAGYVGYELTRQCIKNHCEVAIYDSFSNGDIRARAKIAELSGVKVYENTIADAAGVAAAISEFRPDVVYNLAALHYIPYCIEHPEEVFATNYLGLQNIITVIRDHPNAKFVFASSASVYGSPKEKCTLDTPTVPNDIYGASKLAGEQLIQHQLKNYVIMRLFNVYGDLDPHPHLIPKVSRAAVNNEILELGTASAKRDFVYVRDVANAFFIAHASPKAQTYIVATGELHSVSEVVSHIYAKAKSQGKVCYETQTNMRAKDASLLSGDASKLRSLGWAPTVSFDEGIATTIDAARKQIS